MNPAQTSEGGDGGPIEHRELSRAPESDGTGVAAGVNPDAVPTPDRNVTAAGDGRER
jgi:hypothetical protein